MSESQIQQYLSQKRDQFRIKIRNERLNTYFNGNRRRLLDSADQNNKSSPSSSFRTYLTKEDGVSNFEQRAAMILQSNQLDLEATDSDTLIVLCNLCAVREKSNILLLRQLEIPWRLLKYSGLIQEIKRQHTCLWGLMNYFQIPSDYMEAAIIGDVHKMINEGLVEIVISLHSICIAEDLTTVIVTISELLYNLLWIVVNQPFVQPQENLLSQAKVRTIFLCVLKDLRLFDKKKLAGGLSVEVLHKCLTIDPTLFRLTTEVDVTNLLNTLDRKCNEVVYHTMKLLLLISQGSDDTQIQRLVFMAMIPDVMKQFHNQNKNIRFQAYKIINNLCFSETQSIKEAVASLEVYHEIVLTYNQCWDQESLLELTHVFGNMIERCIEFIGVECIQDSGLAIIVDQKLSNNTNDIELTIALIKLKATLIECKACIFDSQFETLLQNLLMSRNPELAQTAETLIELIK